MPLQRTEYINNIVHAFKVNPVVALLGPRQTGKTTLARAYTEHQSDSMPIHYFDLEDPTDLAALSNPKLVLENCSRNGLSDEKWIRGENNENSVVNVDQNLHPNSFNGFNSLNAFNFDDNA